MKKVSQPKENMRIITGNKVMHRFMVIFIVLLFFSIGVFFLTSSGSVYADGPCGDDDVNPADTSVTPFLSFPVKDKDHLTFVQDRNISSFFDHTHPVGYPRLAHSPEHPDEQAARWGRKDGYVIASTANHGYKSCTDGDDRHTFDTSNLQLGPHWNSTVNDWLYYDDHNGFDYSTTGTVVAAADGYVEFAGALGCYGNTVIIDHWNGYRTQYSHLASISDSIKWETQHYATVNRGDTIGVIGNTAFGAHCSSTGTHLHFSVYHLHHNDYINANIWYPTDPYSYPYPNIDPLITNGPSDDGQEMSSWLWTDLTPAQFDAEQGGLGTGAAGGGDIIYWATTSGITSPAVVAPGQSFSVEIRVKNDGLAPWGKGSVSLVNTGGNFGAPSSLALSQDVLDGDQYSWNFILTAPTQLGTYSSIWQVKSGNEILSNLITVTFVVSNNKNVSLVSDIPNPDNYSCSQPGYIDFEGLNEGTNLSALTITGIQFTTTNGYSWLVGDFATGNYNGKYPSGGYTSQGTHWAWLGTTQGAGRIDFPKGPASYFSLLVSNVTSVFLDAYNANGVKLATVGPVESNYATGHMTELKITRATADIAYVIVHDTGNYFEIDSICTNAPNIPGMINQVLDQSYYMYTGQQVNGNFFLDAASGFWRYLRIFIGPFNSDVDLVITRPDGTVVTPGDPGFVLDKTGNYIEAIVDGANAGGWNYQIIANRLDYGGENIQIAVGEQLVDAANEVHLVDCAGVFRPSNGLLYLRNAPTTGFADIAINYGLPGDYPVVGDWDGNGTATIGIYRNGSFYLRNSNTRGFADLVFPFGQPGDQPIAGDWNGDGVDTIGVYRPSTGQFLLRNSNTTGFADKSFYLGNVGDVGIAGDWDGDGIDATGVFRPVNGMIFLKNTNETGYADIALNYGIPGDRPLAGDWNNDGIDTIGVYRNGVFYLRNQNTVGFADIVFGLGNPGDMPIAGNWDGLP